MTAFLIEKWSSSSHSILFIIHCIFIFICVKCNINFRGDSRRSSRVKKDSCSQHSKYISNGQLVVVTHKKSSSSSFLFLLLFYSFNTIHYYLWPIQYIHVCTFLDLYSILYLSFIHLGLYNAYNMWMLMTMMVMIIWSWIVIIIITMNSHSVCSLYKTFNVTSIMWI